MVIQIKKFGSMIPKVTAPEDLPEEGAQAAGNVNLGVLGLTPLNVTTPFQTFWTGSQLVSGLSSGSTTSDVIYMARPTWGATAFTQAKICQPITGGWLVLNVWIFVVAGSAGTITSTGNCWSSNSAYAPGTPGSVALSNLQYTPGGLMVHAHWSGGQTGVYCASGVPTNVYGPIYQFVFLQDSNYANANGTGGPNANYCFPNGFSSGTMPNVPEFTDNVIPTGGTAPLYFNNQVYGFWQVSDVRGPIYTNGYTLTTTQTIPISGFDADFTINLNYKENRIRYYSFAYSYVDTQQREGPPSEPSQLITLNPGEALTISGIPSIANDGVKLYRAGRDGRDFELLDTFTGQYPADPTLPMSTWLSTQDLGSGNVQKNASQWTDTGVGTQARTGIPPWGNFQPGLAPGSTSTTLGSLVGSILHPAGFGAMFANYTDAAGILRYELWLSGLYRLHAWPKSYVIPFKSSIMAIAENEGMIFVFLQNGDVYSVSGQHPSNMVKMLVSSSMPLLCPQGYCRIGHYVFWVTNDGLACKTWRGAEVVTRNFFTRADWMNLITGSPTGTSAPSSPAFYLAVADNSIFLYNCACGGIKLDIEDYNQVTGVSTFTATTGSTGSPQTGGVASWKSKRFRFEQPVVFDWARVVADGNFALDVYLDGSSTSSLTLTQSNFSGTNLCQLTGLTPAKAWDFEFSSVSATIHEAIFLDRQILPAGEMSSTGSPQAVRLTNKDAQSWRDVWLKFDGANRFVAGAVAAQTGTSNDVNLCNQAGTSQDHQLSLSGPQIFKLSRNTSPLELWRLQVTDHSSGGDPTQGIDELTLYTARTEKIEKEIREVHPGQGVPPWWLKRYELKDRAWIKSVIVNFVGGISNAVSGTACLNIYLDGSATACTGSPFTVYHGLELRIDPPQKCSMVEFDFGGTAGATETTDNAVEEVLIYARRPEEIRREGIGWSEVDNWRGRMGKFPDKGILTCATIGYDTAATAPTLTLYADGSNVYSQSVASTGLIILPRTLNSGNPASVWEMDINPWGNSTNNAPNQIYQAMFKARVRVKVEGDLREVNDKASIPAWAYTVYEFPKNTAIVSAIIKADAYSSLKMNLYANGAQSTTAFSVSSGVEFQVMGASIDPGFLDSIEFNFVDGNGNSLDSTVREVLLFVRQAQEIGANGIGIQDPAHMLGHFFKSSDLFQPATLAVEGPDFTADGNPLHPLQVTLTPQAGAAVVQSVSGPGLIPLSLTAPEAAQWRVDVAVNQPITSLNVCPRARKQINDKKLHVTVRDPETPPWVRMRYQFSESVELVSAWLRVAKTNSTWPLVMWFAFNGNTGTPDASLTFNQPAPVIMAGLEQRIGPMPGGKAYDGWLRVSSVDFWFTDNATPPNRMDNVVNEVALFGHDPQPIDGRGVIIRKAQELNWLHRTFDFPETGSISVARVKLADDTDASLTFYFDGVIDPLSPHPVTSDQEIRLTGMPACRRLEFDLNHQCEVDEVLLIARVTSEVKDGLLRVRKQDDPFTWLGRRIASERPVDFSCGRVLAEAYPVTLTLYQGTQTVLTKLVADNRPFRLPRLCPQRQWEMDANGQPGADIIQVELATSMERLRS